jgi:hypothetical protein
VDFGKKEEKGTRNVVDIKAAASPLAIINVGICGIVLPLLNTLDPRLHRRLKPSILATFTKYATMTTIIRLPAHIAPSSMLKT